MQKLLFNRRNLLIGMVTMMIMIYPITFIHEIGHISSCVAQGGLPSDFKVDLLYGQVNCQAGEDFNEFEFSIAGPLLAMLVALLPAAVYRRLMGRHQKGILLGCITIAFAQGINLILEGFFLDWYLSHVQDVLLLIGMPSLATFLILVFILGRKRTRRVKGEQSTLSPKVTQVCKSSWVNRLQSIRFASMLILGVPISPYTSEDER